MGEAHGARRRNAGTVHGAEIKEWEGRTAHGAGLGWLAGLAGWAGLAGLDWLGFAGNCILSMDKLRRACTARAS